MYLYLYLIIYIYIHIYIGGLRPRVAPEEDEHLIAAQKVIGLGLCIRRERYIHRYRYT